MIQFISDEIFIHLIFRLKIIEFPRKTKSPKKM